MFVYLPNKDKANPYILDKNSELPSESKSSEHKLMFEVIFNHIHKYFHYYLPSDVKEDIALTLGKLDKRFNDSYIPRFWRYVQNRFRTVLRNSRRHILGFKPPRKLIKKNKGGGDGQGGATVKKLKTTNANSAEYVFSQNTISPDAVNDDIEEAERPFPRGLSTNITAIVDNDDRLTDIAYNTDDETIQEDIVVPLFRYRHDYTHSIENDWLIFSNEYQSVLTDKGVYISKYINYSYFISCLV